MSATEGKTFEGPDQPAAGDRVAATVDAIISAAARSAFDPSNRDAVRKWVRDLVNQARNVPAETVTRIIIANVVPALHAAAVSALTDLRNEAAEEALKKHA